LFRDGTPRLPVPPLAPLPGLPAGGVCPDAGEGNKSSVTEEIDFSQNGKNISRKVAKLAKKDKKNSPKFSAPPELQMPLHGAIQAAGYAGAS